MYCASCGTQLRSPGPCPACGRIPAVTPTPPDPVLPPPGNWAARVPTPPGQRGAWPAAALPAPPAYLAATPVRRGRPPFAVGVGMVGVLALMLVMVFVVRGMNGQGTGASSPEDLVGKLQNAVNKEDPAAVLALLDPGELPTLGDLFQTAVRNLDKTQDVDLDGARAALDLDVHDLDYDTTSLGASGNYAKVTFHSGRADWQTKPDQLPDGIKSKATDDGSELPGPESGTVTTDDMQVQTDAGDMLDPFFVLVKTNGRWYVSISMTAGEYAVTVAGLPGGDFDQSDSAPSTAHSPEEAVRQFLTDAVDSAGSGGKNLDRLTNLLPDGQTRALRVYAKALDRSVGNADNETQNDGQSGIRLDKMKVENLKLSISSSHGQTTVRIDRVDLSWESQYESCSYSSFGPANGDGYGNDNPGTTLDDSGSTDLPGTDPGSSDTVPGSDSGWENYDSGSGDSSSSCTTEHEKVELNWDGHCATVTSTATFTGTDSDWETRSEPEPDTACLNDETDENNLGPVDFGITDVHIVVKQERGGWVIDPIATLMDYGRTAVEHLDTAKVRRLLGHEI